MARTSNSKKGLISAFGDRYLLLEHDGGYLLSDKERKSKRSKYCYLGKFYISTNGNKYSFMDNYYEDKDSLITAMDEYNKTLPFDADNFNPINRKNYVIECCVQDYLSDLGFKHKWNSYSGDDYVLEDLYGQKICTINVDVTEDTTKGRIRRFIPNTERWTESEFEDLDGAIGAVNSILSMYCLSIQARTANLLNHMTNARSSNILDNTFDISSLEVYSEDTRKKTIEYLEKELERLKSDKP